MANVQASDFIEDGHTIHFRWDRDELHIAYVTCPYVGVTSMCNRLRDYCVVARFVGTYGTEVNIGSIEITGPVEVAWYPVPGRSDEDEEFRQVWVIPIDDPDLAAAKYLEAEQQSLPEDDES